MVNFHDPAGRSPGRRPAARLLTLGACLLWLTGCASHGNTPLGDALTDLLPEGAAGEASLAQRAGALPYASLAVDSQRHRGLVVMGTAAGETTYWPTGHQGVLVLHRDGLQATSGLGSDLLGTRYLPLQAPNAGAGEAVHRQADTGEADTGEADTGKADTGKADIVAADAEVAGTLDDTLDYVPWREVRPGAFRLERQWLEADGLPRQLGARGALTCHDTLEPLALPLGEQRLQRCEMTLNWENGEQTRSTLWRDRDTLRLWAVEGEPWPGAPHIEWRVARAWW
ncbi:YjbF family lipoprotein [Halomonas icarae]|uniref:YjbF family lipoprotein n=1 Tax=Halomonas icarae TaxID=2691040 RepID=A0A7X4VWI6_9GAMM|nr:YjbF family lipoprotein [Halomonas icarae]MDR5901278.1 hypothetical protein [Halomonas icarae]NAW11556.1 hypothetical protein [Halomonas icarae]